MVKILYGISGEGNGHMTRSWAMIQRLKKDHDIIAVTNGIAYKYLKKRFKKTHRTQDLHLAYKENRIAPFSTFFMNISNIFDLLKSIKKIRRILNNHKPDLIINDFSALTNLMGLIHKIPIITVDNNQLILKTRPKIPLSWWWSRFKASLAIRLMVQTADFRFITSFFFPEVRSKRVMLVPPIIREEVKKIRPSDKGHILVYQTSDSNQDLVNTLNKINAKFLAYGFNRKGNNGNVTFRPFSDKQFLKDLSGARAVIMNGGFSLMTECIYLKKPVLSIPVRDQIEQMINALYLQRLGLGKSINENDATQIKNFLKNIPRYKKNLNKINFDYDVIFKKLQKKILELTN